MIGIPPIFTPGVPQLSTSPVETEGQPGPADTAALQARVAALVRMQQSIQTELSSLLAEQIPVPGSLTQASWFIDPISGNDANDGMTAQSPVRSYNGGIVARWGTTSPHLSQTTTLTWLESQPDGGADPVIFNPIMSQGVGIITGALGASQQLASGVFTAVTPKAIAPPQLLEVAMAGPIAAGSLIANTTAGKQSFAYVHAVISPGVYAMEQPHAPVELPYDASQTPTEINTWAAGDTFVAYEPCHVNLVRVAPTCAMFSSPLFPVCTQLANIVASSADGIPGDNVLDITTDVAMIFVRHDSEVSLSGFLIDSAGAAAWIGCDLSNGLYAPLGLFYIYGGKLADTQTNIVLLSSQIGNDVILERTSAGIFLVSATGAVFIGSCYVSGTIFVQSGDFAGVPATVWGPGSLDFIGAARNHYSAAHTAVATFPLTGGLFLNAQANANAFDPATGTWSGPIPLTAANLDQTFANAGFGGLALNITGTSLSGQGTD